MYDDPRDYREWKEWSDTDNAEQYWAPFPADMGDDSIPNCGASMLAMDEAVIVMDSCSGDTRAQRVRKGQEFRCDPDSDRMLCRLWIPSTLDTCRPGKPSCLIMSIRPSRPDNTSLSPGSNSSGPDP